MADRHRLLADVKLKLRKVNEPAPSSGKAARAGNRVSHYTERR